MVQINQQTPEHKQHDSPDNLDVVDIWYTIQGEGPFGGCPAIFVRLAGCNLQCPLCDTQYTQGREVKGLRSMLSVITSMRTLHDCELIVLTGGEPFRQDIGKFVEMLLGAGFVVQIETNGTMFLDSMPWEFLRTRLHVVCSPKTATIHKRMLSKITSLKYVVQHGRINGRGFPEDVLGNGSVWFPDRKEQTELLDHGVEIFLSPLDEKDPIKNDMNLKAAAEACLDHGHRLCTQLHKAIGVA
jgi:7-carboxy-7-deazaguanine synthase